MGTFSENTMASCSLKLWLSPWGLPGSVPLSVSHTKAGTHSDWTTAVSAQACSAEKTKNRHLEWNPASETNTSLENVRSEHRDVRK